jgi:hypothetical protein
LAQDVDAQGTVRSIDMLKTLARPLFGRSNPRGQNGYKLPIEFRAISAGTAGSTGQSA